MRQKLKATPLIMMLTRDVTQLEHDPDTQYRFNRWFLLFFLWQMPLIIVLLVVLPKLWLAIGLIYCTEISLWSLVATHLGNMISAISAHNAREAMQNTAHSVNVVADTVDDINEDVEQIAEVVAG